MRLQYFEMYGDLLILRTVGAHDVALKSS